MDARISKTMVFGLLLLIAFAVGACGTLEIEQAPAKGESAAAATAMPLPTATEVPLPSPTALPSATPTSVVQAEEINWDSEIASLDETWNLYTSNGQGFSIKFPKTMASYQGSCTWNEEQGSYRPQIAIVPVKIFEGSDAVYIAPETYYRLAGERTETTADGGTRSFFDSCNQVTNSLELLQDPENPYASSQMWKLVVREIHDDAELDAFLKERYGSACSLGEKEPSAQDGVYRVRIQGDGKPIEETQCRLNYRTVVEYYPAGNKVVAWDLGQAATFPADVNYSVIHDQEMVDSFSFFGAAAAEPAAPWVSYSNTEYGFSFEYPTSWTVAEVNDEDHVGPGSRSVQLGQGSVKLVIGYRRAGEETRLVGSGVPGGEFVERGTVRMLDQDVPRQVLVFEGKDKGVYYNRWSAIGAGDLEFALSLQDFDPDYGQAELPQSVQDEADAILGTVKVATDPASSAEPAPTASESQPATELTS